MFKQRLSYISSINMFKALLCLVVGVGSTTVRVKTTKGVVIGTIHDGYDTFHGVPYAWVNPKHPFEKSQPLHNFTEPFVANNPNIMCPQVKIETGGTVQCLTLNIYVPHTKNFNRPVMVWLHGQSFNYGKAGSYGGEYLATEGIIFIAVNFRLGPYGFFCLNDSLVPGNEALRDQVNALRWVQTEIKAFGGDPNSVTVAGQAFGGAYADLHLYSEYEALFDKVIIQSGSLFNYQFFVKPRPQSALELAKYLGKTLGRKTKPRDVLDFLARTDPHQIMDAVAYLNIPFGVCREKTRIKGIKNFIKHDQFHLVNNERIKNTKILVGYNSMELLYMYSRNTSDEFFEGIRNVFYERLEKYYKFKSEKEMTKISKMFQAFYLGGKEIGPETVIKLAESASDYYVNHPIEHSVDSFAKAGATIYKYIFSYTGGSEFNNIPGAGASHEEELKYLFNWKHGIEGEEQMRMRKQLTGMWANFVKFGNPTPNNQTWLTVHDQHRPYLNINVVSTMEHFVYHERIAFLNLFWHNYEKYCNLHAE